MWVFAQRNEVEGRKKRMRQKSGCSSSIVANRTIQALGSNFRGAGISGHRAMGALTMTATPPCDSNDPNRITSYQYCQRLIRQGTLKNQKQSMPSTLPCRIPNGTEHEFAGPVGSISSLEGDGGDIVDEISRDGAPGDRRNAEADAFADTVIMGHRRDNDVGRDGYDSTEGNRPGLALPNDDSSNERENSICPMVQNDMGVAEGSSNTANGTASTQVNEESMNEVYADDIIDSIVRLANEGVYDRNKYDTDSRHPIRNEIKIGGMTCGDRQDVPVVGCPPLHSRTGLVRDKCEIHHRNRLFPNHHRCERQVNCSSSFCTRYRCDGQGNWTFGGMVGLHGIFSVRERIVERCHYRSQKCICGGFVLSLVDVDCSGVKGREKMMRMCRQRAAIETEREMDERAVSTTTSIQRMRDFGKLGRKWWNSEIYGAYAADSSDDGDNNTSSLPFDSPPSILTLYTDSPDLVNLAGQAVSLSSAFTGAFKHYRCNGYKKNCPESHLNSHHNHYKNDFFSAVGRINGLNAPLKRWVRRMQSLSQYHFLLHGLHRQWPKRALRTLDLPDASHHFLLGQPMDWTVATTTTTTIVLSSSCGYLSDVPDARDQKGQDDEANHRRPDSLSLGDSNSKKKEIFKTEQRQHHFCFATALLQSLFIALTDESCSPGNSAHCLWETTNPRNLSVPSSAPAQLPSPSWPNITDSTLRMSEQSSASPLVSSSISSSSPTSLTVSSSPLSLPLSATSSTPSLSLASLTSPAPSLSALPGSSTSPSSIVISSASASSSRSSAASIAQQACTHRANEDFDIPFDGPFYRDRDSDGAHYLRFRDNYRRNVGNQSDDRHRTGSGSTSFSTVEDQSASDDGNNHPRDQGGFDLSMNLHENDDGDDLILTDVFTTYAAASAAALIEEEEEEEEKRIRRERKRRRKTSVYNWEIGVEEIHDVKLTECEGYRGEAAGEDGRPLDNGRWSIPRDSTPWPPPTLSSSFPSSAPSSTTSSAQMNRSSLDRRNRSLASSASSSTQRPKSQPRVTAVQFCKSHPEILAVGFESGDIEIWAPFLLFDTSTTIRNEVEGGHDSKLPSIIGDGMVDSDNQDSTDSLNSNSICTVCSECMHKTNNTTSIPNLVSSNNPAASRSGYRSISTVDSEFPTHPANPVNSIHHDDSNSVTRSENFSPDRIMDHHQDMDRTNSHFNDANNEEKNPRLRRPLCRSAEALTDILYTGTIAAAHTVSSSISSPFPRVQSSKLYRYMRPAIPPFAPSTRGVWRSAVIAIAWHPTELLLVTAHQSRYTHMWRFMCVNSNSDDDGRDNENGRGLGAAELSDKKTKDGKLTEKPSHDWGKESRNGLLDTRDQKGGGRDGPFFKCCVEKDVDATFFCESSIAADDECGTSDASENGWEETIANDVSDLYLEKKLPLEFHGRFGREKSKVVMVLIHSIAIPSESQIYRPLRVCCDDGYYSLFNPYYHSYTGQSPVSRADCRRKPISRTHSNHATDINYGFSSGHGKMNGRNIIEEEEAFSDESDDIIQRTKKRKIFLDARFSIRNSHIKELESPRSMAWDENGDRIVIGTANGTLTLFCYNSFLQCRRAMMMAFNRNPSLIQISSDPLAEEPLPTAMCKPLFTCPSAFSLSSSPTAGRSPVFSSLFSSKWRSTSHPEHHSSFSSSSSSSTFVSSLPSASPASLSSFLAPPPTTSNTLPSIFSSSTPSPPLSSGSTCLDVSSNINNLRIKANPVSIDGMILPFERSSPLTTLSHGHEKKTSIIQRYKGISDESDMTCHLFPPPVSHHHYFFHKQNIQHIHDSKISDSTSKCHDHGCQLHQKNLGLQPPSHLDASTVAGESPAPSLPETPIAENSFCCGTGSGGLCIDANGNPSLKNIVTRVGEFNIDCTGSNTANYPTDCDTGSVNHCDVDLGSSFLNGGGDSSDNGRGNSCETGSGRSDDGCGTRCAKKVSDTCRGGGDCVLLQENFFLGRIMGEKNRKSMEGKFQDPGILSLRAYPMGGGEATSMDRKSVCPNSGRACEESSFSSNYSRSSGDTTECVTSGSSSSTSSSSVSQSSLLSSATPPSSLSPPTHLSLLQTILPSPTERLSMIRPPTTLLNRIDEEEDIDFPISSTGRNECDDVHQNLQIDGSTGGEKENSRLFDLNNHDEKIFDKTRSNSGRRIIENFGANVFCKKARFSRSPGIEGHCEDDCEVNDHTSSTYCPVSYHPAIQKGQKKGKRGVTYHEHPRLQQQGHHHHSKHVGCGLVDRKRGHIQGSIQEEKQYSRYLSKCNQALAAQQSFLPFCFFLFSIIGCAKESQCQCCERGRVGCGCVIASDDKCDKNCGERRRFESQRGARVSSRRQHRRQCSTSLSVMPLCYMGYFVGLKKLERKAYDNAPITSALFCPFNYNIVVTGGGAGDDGILKVWRLGELCHSGCLFAIHVDSAITSMLWSNLTGELLVSHDSSRERSEISSASSSNSLTACDPCSSPGGGRWGISVWHYDGDEEAVFKVGEFANGPSFRPRSHFDMILDDTMLAPSTATSVADDGGTIDDGSVNGDSYSIVEDSSGVLGNTAARVTGGESDAASALASRRVVSRSSLRNSVSSTATTAMGFSTPSLPISSFPTTSMAAESSIATASPLSHSSASASSRLIIDRDNAACLVQSSDGRFVAYWSLPGENISVWELPDSPNRNGSTICNKCVSSSPSSISNLTGNGVVNEGMSQVSQIFDRNCVSLRLHNCCWGDDKAWESREVPQVTWFRPCHSCGGDVGVPWRQLNDMRRKENDNIMAFFNSRHRC